ncbi:hypothetical protein BGZ63DRAFT_405367 [Mariannaea sp. PMI_226]|nr:hypothetical protein BGZ63DRAFT_405367 [Mariannaea sp. PMI_226]
MTSGVLYNLANYFAGSSLLAGFLCLWSLYIFSVVGASQNHVIPSGTCLKYPQRRFAGHSTAASQSSWKCSWSIPGQVDWSNCVVRDRTGSPCLCTQSNHISNVFPRALAKLLPYQKLEELHAKYGPIVRIGPKEVSISDWRYLRSIYGNAKGVIKNPAFYEAATFVGKHNVFEMM